jgi:hypothetical protein
MCFSSPSLSTSRGAGVALPPDGAGGEVTNLGIMPASIAAQHGGANPVSSGLIKTNLGIMPKMAPSGLVKTNQGLLPGNVLTFQGSLGGDNEEEES